MINDRKIKYNLFPDSEKSEFMFLLNTDLGEKNIYDSASQCNRCGYCYEQCPSYLVSRQENYSPRGRNQLIKTVVEQRVRVKNDADEIYDCLSTCLVCGACMSACYGRVPTHKIVTEARRPFFKTKIPGYMRCLLNISRKKLAKFSFVLKFTDFIKICGILGVFRKLEIFKLLRLKHPDDIYSPTGKSKSEFSGQSQNIKNKNPKCLYFVSCAANYAYPEIAKATVNILERFIAAVKPLKNPCCGVLSFTYSNLKTARENAKKIISLYEKESADIKIVTDCSSCAYHLKSYPELFLQNDLWHKKALKFADNVRDITEIFPPDEFSQSIDLKNKRITYHHSACAYHKQGLDAEKIIKKVSGSNFVQMKENTIPCGGELGFNLINPKSAGKLLKRKISAIAAVRSDYVVTSDGFSLAFIEYGLKRYYPLTKAIHISIFLNLFFGGEK